MVQRERKKHYENEIHVINKVDHVHAFQFLFSNSFVQPQWVTNRNSLFLCDAERALGLASQPDKSTDLKNSIHSIEKINYKIARSAHFEEYQKIECVNELGREREREFTHLRTIIFCRVLRVH